MSKKNKKREFPLHKEHSKADGVSKEFHSLEFFCIVLYPVPFHLGRRSI